LNKIALEVLTKRINEGSSPNIFPSPDDAQKPVIKLNHAHYGALERSGMKRFRLYDLCHTWATRAAMAGVDLVTLAALLGHSRIQMVLRYAHPTEDHQMEAMKKLESYNIVGQIAALEQQQGLTATIN
jgi:integrase